MRDAVSQRRVSALHPKVRSIFENFVNEIEETLDITIRVAQGLRTIDEQNALYAKGRTKPGPKVTDAKGGQSYHNYGLAIDIVPLINNGTALDWNFKYKKVLPIAKKYGLIWGADWNNNGITKAEGDKNEGIVDQPHYQITFGYNWRTLLDKYNKKEFIPGTQYVKI